MFELFSSIPPEYRALLGSFFFACNQILVRKLTDRTSPLTVTIMTNFWMSVTALFLIPLSDSFEGNFLRALLFFVGVGLLGQATARYLAYSSNKIIGVSRTNTVVAGSPIGASLMGVVILGERPAPEAGFGIILIVVGLIFMTSERGEGRQPLKSYTFAFVAMLAFSVTPYLRKGGMLALSAPAFGVIFSTIIANSTLLATSRAMPGPHKFRLNRSMALASIPAGVFGMAAAINFWTALRDGPLTIISPLIRMTPIFVLLLSMILLRGKEIITKRLVLATLIVVVGAALITANP
ncbi:MAG: DMT family transporter [Nitrospinota bacterium]|nr:DMT family transporter [Nitrospinota bacterium]MDP7370767.1 DMT family transporter [Nitrospinota bacterium]MDP7664553.1 DMT family transporter [Nitrospinota bacterium]